MLVIVSNAKASKLDALLNPILGHLPVKSKVITVTQLIQESLDETDTVLLMGSKPFEVLQQLGLVGKKQSIGASRETVFLASGVKTLVTYDPNLADFMPEVLPDIKWDVYLAARVAITGFLTPTALGSYQYVEDFKEVVDWALGLPAGGFQPLALDLETVGLDEFAPTARILTVQLTYKLGHALVYRVPESGMSDLVWNQLNGLFTFERINTIGANLKYDMRWLAHVPEISVTNHRFDTQLVGGLLDENRFNNLKGHIKQYAPTLGGYEDSIEGKWDKARMDIALAHDPDGFLRYAGGDTDGVFRIYPEMRAELWKDPALTLFYARLLHPASIAFQKLETRGILIDHPRYIELAAEAEIEMGKQSEDCFAMMPYKIKYKYADNLKLSRPVIIKEFLFGPEGLGLKPVLYTEGSEKLVEQGKPPEPSTAYKHLKTFVDHPEAGPFIKKYKEFKVTEKALSTYIVGFLEHLRSDGKFHPSYILAKGGQAGDEDIEGGTNTGRSSCKSPAYQTWPKRTAWAKRLRTVVICPPGHVIVKLDYGQGELRIMADASNCKAMIQNYLNGDDLHAVTAAGFLYPGVPLAEALAQFKLLSEDEIEKHRTGAKAGNFGLIYRISPEGYQQFAATAYNVNLTIEQAQANHAAFFKTYPEIETYHKNQVKHAQKHKFVRNQLGRVRHLPLINSWDNKLRGQAERQAINAPTQGCLFDMMMLLMSEINRLRPDIWLFGNTHDSLEMYLKQETWMEDSKQIKQIAEHLPLEQFGWTPKVPFVVDFEMSSTNLAELKKVKLQ